jgi:hypothetical protein
VVGSHDRLLAVSVGDQKKGGPEQGRSRAQSLVDGKLKKMINSGECCG